MDEIFEVLVYLANLVGCEVKDWQDVVQLCGGTGALAAGAWKSSGYVWRIFQWMAPPKMNETTKAVYQQLDKVDNSHISNWYSERDEGQVLGRKIEIDGLSIRTNYRQIFSIKTNGEDIPLPVKHFKRVNKMLLGKKGIFWGQDGLITAWVKKQEEKEDLAKAQKIRNPVVNPSTPMERSNVKLDMEALKEALKDNLVKVHPMIPKVTTLGSAKGV